MSGVFDVSSLMILGNFFGIAGGKVHKGVSAVHFFASTAFISEVSPLGCSLQAEAMMLRSSASLSPRRGITSRSTS